MTTDTEQTRIQEASPVQWKDPGMPKTKSFSSLLAKSTDVPA